MSRSGQGTRREKVNLCFITSDPSSNDGKTSNLHIVRSHAGKWRWSEARKKRGHVKREKSDSCSNFTAGLSYDCTVSIEETDASDSSASNPYPDSSKDTSPDEGLEELINTLEAKVSGTEYSEDFQFDQFHPPHSDQIPRSNWPGDHNEASAGVDLYGIAASILDPFQQYPHTSPLPSELSLLALSVLWPGLLPASFGANHPAVNAWLMNSATHDALHSTLLFGSYSHRRTLWLVKKRGHFSNEDAKRLAICEADAIMRVNKAIQNLSAAATDCIILCVLCMATNKVEGPMWKHHKERPFQAPLTSLQWLDIYGRLSPHPIHQAGLVQLVRLRGGLDKIELPGLAAIISFSSVLGASRALARPSFPYISLRTGGHLELQDITSDINYATDVEPFKSTHMPLQMQDIFHFQRTYVNEVEMYEDGMHIATDVLCDHRNLIQWHIMSLLPSTQLGESHADAYPLYEACRLALIVFAVGVTFPLPPQSAPLETLARMLKIELQSYDKASKTVPPETLSLNLWILTLGGIAATGSADRGWFTDKLKIHTTCYGPSTWQDFESELKSVLWLERACGLGGRLMWNEVMGL